MPVQEEKRRNQPSCFLLLSAAKKREDPSLSTFKSTIFHNLAPCQGARQLFRTHNYYEDEGAADLCTESCLDKHSKEKPK